MKAGKTIICILLISSLLFSLFFVFGMGSTAATGPTISIGSATGCVGDRVTVPVTIENNPGVVGVFLDIAYDPTKLSLVDATDTELLSGGIFTNKLEQTPFALTWEASLDHDNTSNGVIANLTFEILEVCEDETIALSSPHGIINYDMEFVQFDLISGVIHTSEASVPVSEITLSQTQLHLDPSETLALSAVVAPSNATNQTLKWTSSDETVAVVSDTGEVTALKGGSAIITATATDGSGISAACTVDILVGDINKDGSVDSDDVLLLMQYSILPDIYPISYKGNVDFNYDGSIDSLDVIMLMQYSILPDLYPLD